MSYIVCPTCNYPIGQLVVKIENDIKKIKNDPKLNSSEIADEIAKLYNSFGLRLCCKMRLMTYSDTFDIIN